jgi:hypothetical protein
MKDHKQSVSFDNFLRQPFANRIDDANRRLAEMKLALLSDPVCLKQRVSPANPSQENRGFGAHGNTKYNRASGGTSEIH